MEARNAPQKPKSYINIYKSFSSFHSKGLVRVISNWSWHLHQVKR